MLTRLHHLRGKVWAYKSSLTSPRFSEVPISSKESERSCICVLGVSILPLSTNFQWWLLFTVPYMLPCIQSSSGRIKPKIIKLAFVFTCSTKVKVQRLVGSKSGYCVRVKQRVYPCTIVSVSKEWWSSTMRILLIISLISTCSQWDSQSIVYLSLNNNISPVESIDVSRSLVF
jgi:hypothetical protein